MRQVNGPVVWDIVVEDAEVVGFEELVDVTEGLIVVSPDADDCTVVCSVNLAVEVTLEFVAQEPNMNRKITLNIR
jgi:hypothetical protein